MRTPLQERILAQPDQPIFNIPAKVTKTDPETNFPLEVEIADDGPWTVYCAGPGPYKVDQEVEVMVSTSETTPDGLYCEVGHIN